MVARRLIGRTPYKNGIRSKQQVTHQKRRQDLVQLCVGTRLQQTYGLKLHLVDGLADRLIGEPSADGLDSLLCAIQAAWSWTRRAANFGIPCSADPLAGWILDPRLH